MIHIFHGDNFILSRNELNAALLNQTVNRYEAKDLTAEKLTQILESRTLFGEANLIFINQLPKPELIKIIAQNQQFDIYLWVNKTLSVSVIKTFGAKAKIHEFKLAGSIFTFLEHPSIKSLHLALKSNPIELVFYLFCRRISQLIQIKDNPDLVKTSPWQKQKLLSQARSWTLKQLLSWHNRLLKLDFAQKTGQDPFNLITAFEQLWL